MVWLAGERIVSARLAHDSGGTPLSNDSVSAVSAWETWGTETVIFNNPTVPCKVSGQVTGRAVRSVASSALVQCRVGISFDGGLNFTYGNEPAFNAGNLAGNTIRPALVASHYRDGLPIGNIVVRAEILTGTDTSVSWFNGYLTADMVIQ